MPDNRRQLRGTVLVEDRRTERFFRELLVCLGFDKHKFIFKTAPSGKGDAGAWVRAQYVEEVKLLRQKKYQKSLSLLAARDGDSAGFTKKKIDLDAALRDAMMDQRQEDERIATPVPTWSIETWLLALLGDDTADETASRKQEFERQYPGKEEGQALHDAAKEWHSRADRVPLVPSLAGGKIELSRIDAS